MNILKRLLFAILSIPLWIVGFFLTPILLVTVPVIYWILTGKDIFRHQHCDLIFGLNWPIMLLEWLEL